MPESEFILLRRFASNDDAEAFAEIIKQHASLVYGVCLRILEDKDKAADAVQETFLQLVRDAAEITGSLPNWLHRVATHRAIDIIRNDSQRKQCEIKYTADSQKKQSDENKVKWKEISACIDEELDSLDELTREVIILHFFEGTTMTDIAEKFGISQPTVSRRIESGVATLRHKLKSRGILIPAAMLTTMLTENMVKAAPASIMKDLGKIALAGGKASIGPKIATGISAAKIKIIATSTAAIIGIGSVIMYLNYTKAAVPVGTERLGIPDVNDILLRFAQERNKYTSFIVEMQSSSESKGGTIYGRNGEIISSYNDGVIYSRGQTRFDGHRSSVRGYIWGDLGPVSGNVSKDKAHYSSQLWDGENYYSYSRAEPSTQSGAMVLIQRTKMPSITEERKKILENMTIKGSDFVGEMMGYHFGDQALRIDEVMAKAEDIKLRDNKENLRGVDCYVIDAVVKGFGKYTLWIDPVHDYHIAKIHVLRKEGDNLSTRRLKKDDSSDEMYEIMSFQKIGDSWFPQQYHTVTSRRTTSNDDGETGVSPLQEATINFNSIILNPDHDALNSFVPDDIPNGTTVIIVNISTDIHFVWQDGKVVDSEGQEINFENY